MIKISQKYQKVEGMICIVKPFKMTIRGAFIAGIAHFFFFVHSQFEGIFTLHSFLSSEILWLKAPWPRLSAVATALARRARPR
jgi:hypothetical protein